MISAKLNPQNAAAFRFLGHYYAQFSVDAKRALKCYQRAVSLNPDDSHSGVHCSSSFDFLYNSCSVSSYSFPFKKIKTKNRSLCVIYWTMKERRVWRCLCAETLQKSRLRLFGHFGDWVTCSFIKTNGLKLYSAFNMPFGVILPVLIYGKYVYYSIFHSCTRTLTCFYVCMRKSMYIFYVLIDFGCAF